MQQKRCNGNNKRKKGHKQNGKMYREPEKGSVTKGIQSLSLNYEINFVFTLILP